MVRPCAIVISVKMAVVGATLIIVTIANVAIYRAVTLDLAPYQATIGASLLREPTSDDTLRDSRSYLINERRGRKAR